jgi:hypothetical protein
LDPWGVAGPRRDDAAVIETSDGGSDEERTAVDLLA